MRVSQESFLAFLSTRPLTLQKLQVKRNKDDYTYLPLQKY